MLAQSYEFLEMDTLDVFFPDRNINERTIVVETVKYGIGTAPLVQPGRLSGNYLGNGRMERRTFEPCLVREEDFLDQYLINQLREMGTDNTITPVTEIVGQRIQRLVNRQSATKKLLKALVLRGGVNYVDGRTDVSINVSTNIPLHNFFRYDGYDSVVAAGATIGAYTAGALRFGAEKVLAVEPNPNTYKSLKSTFLEFSNVFTVWGVVSNSDDDFIYGNFEVGNSVGNRIQDDGQIKVPNYKLLQLIKFYKIDKIRLLKIDIEGEEYNVVPNLDDEILNITSCIHLETHHQYGGDDKHLIDFLISKNFQHKLISDRTSIVSVKEHLLWK
jgi:FkbM family methyltransferase